ncbi:MAG: OmpA family protein, partial [Xanthomonadaceae bacterium]|nr:OmpA family protein [Xanthomonadaceae bacterium]
PEISARTEAAQKELKKLEMTRGELLVEVSRRDAERARQEAERLRIQAQIQAEEAERLRQEAAAEAAAREDIEQTLGRMTSRQTAQLNAARRQEAELARQEAELVADARLPPSRFSGTNEIFTISSSAYSTDGAELTAAGKNTVKALAAYLQISRNNRVRIEAYDADAALAQRRAESLRAALAAAGVPGNRMQASGKAGPATQARAVQITVSP